MKHSLFSSKKGLEIAITTLIVLIISILVLGLSLTLLWKVYGGATQVQATIERSTEAQIESLLAGGKDLVVVPLNIKEVKKGEFAIFGLGIRYIGTEASQDFYVTTSFDGAYDLNGKDSLGIPIDEEQWLGGFQKEGPYNIKNNKNQLLPIQVRASATKPGLYVFNVCVTTEELDSCIVENTEIYDKIRQITVRVK